MLQPGDYVWRRGRIIDDAVEACTEPDTGAIELGRYVEGDSWWIADADGGLGELDPNSAPVIPDVPNLAHIARFLDEHPETVDALVPAIKQIGSMIPHYADWIKEANRQPLDVVPQESRDLLDTWRVDAEKHLALLSGLRDAMRGEGGHGEAT